MNLTLVAIMFNATSWWTHAHLINFQLEFIVVCAHSYRNFSTLLDLCSSLSDLNLVWCLRVWVKLLWESICDVFVHAAAVMISKKIFHRPLEKFPQHHTKFFAYLLAVILIALNCETRVFHVSHLAVTHEKMEKTIPARFSYRRMVACGSEFTRNATSRALHHKKETLMIIK